MRKREQAIESELRSLEASAVDQQNYLQLADNIEMFLSRIHTTSNTLNVTERQKILRLLVKEILVDRDTITIRHSIPVTNSNLPPEPSGNKTLPGYLLRSGSHNPALWCAFTMTFTTSGRTPFAISIFFNNRSLEPLLDQRQHRTIADAFCQYRQ